MKILIACEFSGTVRDAFIARGHDAVSCDLLPTERLGPHVQGDVLPMLSQKWDLIIAHPPCTYLANSGARWLFEERGRWLKLDAGCDFFLACLNANAPRVAVENPWPHKWAMAQIGRKPNCKIQPWEFGHEQKKQTCFWTKNLPPLMPTRIVGPPPTDKTELKNWEMVWRMPPGPDQAKNRSKTFQGIADAMADQWGEL